MLDQMLRIPQGNPQTAGWPDRIVILRSCLQRPHDINGALIGDLNIDPGFLRAVLKNLLQLPVFRTGKDPHRLSSSEGGKRRGLSVSSLLPSSGACRSTAAQKGHQKQKSQKQTEAFIFFSVMDHISSKCRYFHSSTVFAKPVCTRLYPAGFLQLHYIIRMFGPYKGKEKSV